MIRPLSVYTLFETHGFIEMKLGHPGQFFQNS